MPEVPAVPDASPPRPDLDPGLETRVAEALADDGALARAMPAFEPRPGQRRMAAAAARVLESGGVLLAEAGTGTGKTLAYLVPAILSGQRVLISTGTKNLQDQIYYKDLPDLQHALGVDFRATYMKGRGNYLCLHRFATTRAEAAGSLLPLAEASSTSSPSGPTRRRPATEPRSRTSPTTWPSGTTSQPPPRTASARSAPPTRSAS